MNRPEQEIMIHLTPWQNRAHSITEAILSIRLIMSTLISMKNTASTAPAVPVQISPNKKSKRTTESTCSTNSSWKKMCVRLKCMRISKGRGRWICWMIWSLKIRSLKKGKTKQYITKVWNKIRKEKSEVPWGGYRSLRLRRWHICLTRVINKWPILYRRNVTCWISRDRCKTSWYGTTKRGYTLTKKRWQRVVQYSTKLTDRFSMHTIKTNQLSFCRTRNL